MLFVGPFPAPKRFVNGEQLLKYPHKPPFPTPPGNKYLFPLEVGDEINFGGFEVGLGPLGTLGMPKEVSRVEVRGDGGRRRVRARSAFKSARNQGHDCASRITTFDEAQGR